LGEILTLEGALRLRATARALGRRFVFTNGCFDVLHPGHVALLKEANRHGDFLIVGLNTDASVQRLKGPTRPVQDEQSRATVIAALGMVDGVVLFDEDTPREMIQALVPDVLVKGGDYTKDQVVGRDVVESAGGEVIIVPLLTGHSSTTLAEKLRTA
jgi:D-beta-D-heptose 7-phosphate kinase/D-beta-D-heptose 1-phosphate adenosyltransferase